MPPPAVGSPAMMALSPKVRSLIKARALFLSERICHHPQKMVRMPFRMWITREDGSEPEWGLPRLREGVWGPPPRRAGGVLWRDSTRYLYDTTKSNIEIPPAGAPPPG